MYSYEANHISVISLSAPYEVKTGHAANKMHQKITVTFHDDHEGLTKELTVSNEVYPLEKIKVGGNYMVICTKSGYAKFFMDNVDFLRREAFVGELYPALKNAITKLEWAFSNCNPKSDRKLIRSTIDSLFYTLIALGRESDLPADTSFFRTLPF